MKYFMLIALACNLLSSNPMTLAKSLQSKEISLYYYYWKNDDDKYYLGKKSNDGNYSVWLYTDDRKWKPFHNADAFDGFSKAGKIYESLSFEDGNIIIKTKGNSDDPDEPKNDEPPSSEPPLPFKITKSVEENTKIFKVAYYFWLDENGMSFLSRPINNETSIWNYTIARKWMPIYNAKKFDEFSPIGKTFDSAKIDNALSKISIGKFRNPFKEDFNLRLSSDSVGDNNSLTTDFLMMTPHFSWTYDEQYKTINQAFIFQITKKDGALVYSTLLSKDTNFIEEGRGKNGTVLALPMNSFCEKEYMTVNNTNDSKVEYIASIYAIYDTSILNKATCTTDATKEDTYLAKSSMDISIIVGSTVKTQSDVSYSKDVKNISGSVRFTFKNEELKESLEDLKSHINLTNLPEGFSVSKDLNIAHDIINSKTLKLIINNTNITLDKKMINIEFLDTLFNKVPKSTQRAIIDIKDAVDNSLPLP